MKNLPFELINYIFSFLNTCIIKNKNNINLRLINKYFKKHTRKCSPGVFFNKHCKYHYKEIFVETDDLWTIYIEYKYKNNYKINYYFE
jgi:hypothetical protein